MMVIGKCTVVFRGFALGFGVEGRGLCGRIFPWRNMSWENRNSMKRAQGFLKLLKKSDKKINMEKFFQLRRK